MLHFYLSALAVESFAALTILIYAKDKFNPETLEEYRRFYVNDIENILNQQFNANDQQNGLQAVLDASAFTTEWPNRISKEKPNSSDGCKVMATPVGSYCYGQEKWHVFDNYRSKIDVS